MSIVRLYRSFSLCFALLSLPRSQQTPQCQNKKKVWMENENTTDHDHDNDHDQKGKGKTKTQSNQESLLLLEENKSQSQNQNNIKNKWLTCVSLSVIMLMLIGSLLTLTVVPDKWKLLSFFLSLAPPFIWLCILWIDVLRS
jgi:hypothetical protein